MTQSIKSCQTFCVHVIAASPAASLAIPSIAGILGIEPQQAASRLASLPSVLTCDVTGSEAKRLSALLMVFGFQVRLDPTLSTDNRVSDDRSNRDLAVQAVAGVNRALLVKKVAAALGLPLGDVVAGLDGPQGLVLRGASEGQGRALRQAVGRAAEMRLIWSDPTTASFDAFAQSDVDAMQLARLGFARCAFSGAIAAQMNGATAQHLSRRMPGRLTILNRDFQRFDLLLKSAPNLAERELCDFLSSRPATMARVWTNGTPALPRLIETDLTRAVAEQFAADYAAIGINVVAHLRGSTQNA